MKVTSEINDYVLHNLHSMCILFDDKTEVELNHICSYDIDLDKIESSIINFVSHINNKELQNHFLNNKKNKITHIHMKFTGSDCDEGQWCDVFYDIPCNMMIRKVRSLQDGWDEVGKVTVELEGVVM